MTIWFISDTHFGHRKIIEYCNRPFKDVGHMDEVMIANWNNKVGQNDIVYHLGDFALNKDPEKYLRRLNGQKFLIRGNHDKRPRVDHGWANIWDYRELRHEKQNIVLCHYAMRVWNKSHHGAIMLYGHSHGNLPGTDQSLDVGVDCWNYSPTSLEDIKRRLKTLPPYKQADHHKIDL